MRRTTKPPIVKKGPKQPLTGGARSEVVVRDYRLGDRAFAKYNEKVPLQVLQMSQLGMTIEQMARILMVAEKTMESWLANRQEVRDAYEKGKWQFDVEVELSLRQRALGYEYEEVKIYEGVDAVGRPWSRTVSTIKRVEPDTTAQIFWLKNRHPDRWRDVWNVNSTNVNLSQVNINNTLNLDSLSQEEREMVASIAMNQIEGLNGIVTE